MTETGEMLKEGKICMKQETLSYFEDASERLCPILTLVEQWGGATGSQVGPWDLVPHGPSLLGGKSTSASVPPPLLVLVSCFLSISYK